MKTPFPVLVFTALALLSSGPALASNEFAVSVERDEVRQPVEQVRHAVVVVDESASAANPSQRWTTRFDTRGALTTPNDGDWNWGLEFTEVRFGAGLEELLLGLAPAPVSFRPARSSRTPHSSR